MSEDTSIVLHAQVAACEKRGVVAAAEQLVSCLGAASGSNIWSVQLEFSSPDRPLSPVPKSSVIILSLLPDAARLNEPMGAIEARWRMRVPPLVASGVPIFLRTVFRHVGERTRDGRSPPLLERIRRLNRMAVDLSHAYGLGVIDIDRAFTHIGAKPLGTDWRLGGALAAELAGHTMAWSMLSYGLDDAINPMVQEQARQKLGSLGAINSLLQRRLAQRQVLKVPSRP